LCIFKRNQSSKAQTAEIIPSPMAWEIGKYLVPDPDPREPNNCGSESTTLPPNYLFINWFLLACWRSSWAISVKRRSTLSQFLADVCNVEKIRVSQQYSKQID
jgi:hypothetical protein